LAADRSENHVLGLQTRLRTVDFDPKSGPKIPMAPPTVGKRLCVTCNGMLQGAAGTEAFLKPNSSTLRGGRTVSGVVRRYVQRATRRRPA